MHLSKGKVGLSDTANSAELSFSPTWREAFRREHRGNLVVTECRTPEGIDSFVIARDGMPAELSLFLLPYTSQDYLDLQGRVFLTTDLRGGFALIGDELASLFSYPGMKYGRLLTEQAIALGAQRLSCYDLNGTLSRFYASIGFREILRSPWKEQLAPQGWSYARFGTPDYVEMSL